MYPSTYKAAVAPPTLIRGGTVLTGSGARLDGADHEKKAAAGSKDAKPPPPRDLRLETLAAAL